MHMQLLPTVNAMSLSQIHRGPARCQVHTRLRWLPFGTDATAQPQPLRFPMRPRRSHPQRQFTGILFDTAVAASLQPMQFLRVMNYQLGLLERPVCWLHFGTEITTQSQSLWSLRFLAMRHLRQLCRHPFSTVMTHSQRLQCRPPLAMGHRHTQLCWLPFNTKVTASSQLLRLQAPPAASHLQSWLPFNAEVTSSLQTLQLQAPLVRTHQQRRLCWLLFDAEVTTPAQCLQRLCPLTMRYLQRHLCWLPPDAQVTSWLHPLPPLTLLVLSHQNKQLC